MPPRAAASRGDGGDIGIDIRPDPSVGIRAWLGSDHGAARVAIDGGVQRDRAGDRPTNQDFAESPAYSGKPVRFEVRASSMHGKVNVASIPSAPLPQK